MNQPAEKSPDTNTDANPKDATHAKHGASSEVTWDGGAGRQPYTNQGMSETSTAEEGEAAEGDRGALSGNNLEQQAAVKGKP
ncbi:MAG: hypothetical protein V4787_04535 [Pseudomonadota bacterium]